MKIYGIFLKKDNKGVVEDLQLIKEGFNFLAFIFQFFYLLYKKLWKESIIIGIILIFLNGLSYGFVSQYIISVIEIGISAYIGYEYFDWKRKQLIKDGYEFLGYSSGNNEKEAKLKYLENINNTYNDNDKLEQRIF